MIQRVIDLTKNIISDIPFFAFLLECCLYESIK